MTLNLLVGLVIVGTVALWAGGLMLFVRYWAKEEGKADRRRAL